MIKAIRTCSGLLVKWMLTRCTVNAHISIGFVCVGLMRAIVESRLVVCKVIFIDTADMLDRGLPASPSKGIWVRRVGVCGRDSYVPW